MIILIFLVNIVEMVYELVAARAISPYYGNGNYVMTAIIAVMLLSGSIGNVIGGKLTKKEKKYHYLSLMFAAGSIILSICLLSLSYVFLLLGKVFTDTRLSVSVFSLLFFIPALTMGIFTPIAMDDILSRYPKGEIGEKNGNIHAAIAIGSLTGTILGGFVLIPLIGTNSIFKCIIIFMLVISVIYLCLHVKTVMAKEGLSKSFANTFKATPLFLLGLIFVSIMFNFSQFVSSADPTVFGSAVKNEMSFDTAYGRILVYDRKVNDDWIRYYKQDGSYASATYLDEEKKYEPVYDYVKAYDAFDGYIDAKNTMMIGGAAYQYPKHFISKYKDKNMDVVEINGECEKIARKYFYLDDLFEDFGNERLKCITEDGRVYLNTMPDGHYDVIFNDAFSGGHAIATLCTKECDEIIKSKLSDDGLFISNCIGCLGGDSGTFIRSNIKTLKEVFKYVYVLPASKLDKNYMEQYLNWLVVATDNPYRPDNAMEVTYYDSDYFLTDDFCPVELLSSYE